MSIAQTTPVVASGVIEAEYEVETSTALAQLNASEIDIQIATANKYPRSITKFRQEVFEFATLDEETAASMFYRLPRGWNDDGTRKFIEGPSVRLAEVAAASYKNLRFGSRVIEVGDKFITAQGFCYDLEKNTAIACEVRRRITGKNGKRFDDDMITVTGNAASSIALRNAIFKIIPLAYIKPAFNEAQQVCLGKGKTIQQRRNDMLDWWKKKGATVEQVYEALGIAGYEDLGNEELLTLRGLATAVKDGDITMDAALAKPEAPDGPKVSSSAVNDKLAKAKKDKPKAEVDTKTEPAVDDTMQASNPQDA